MRRRISVTALLIGAAVMISACGGGSSTGSSNNSPIKVASIYPFTGPEAQYGLYDDWGWQLAEQQFGSTVNGHPIQRLKFDDKCVASDAVNAVRQVIGSGAIVVDGPACSGNITATQLTLEAAKLPVVTLAFTPYITQHGDHYLWQISPNDALLNGAMAQYMAEQSVKSVGIAYDSLGYGQEQAQTITAALQFQGITPKISLSYQDGAADFSGEISRFITAGVDSVYVGGYDGDVGHFEQQAKQLGLNVKFFTPDTGGTSDFLQAAGDAAIGSSFSTPFISSRPQFAAFVSKWQSMFGKPPTDVAIEAYLSAATIIKALQAAGSNPTAESVNNALKGISVKIAPFGTVAFTDTGAQKCPSLLIGTWTNAQAPTLVKDLTVTC